MRMRVRDEKGRNMTGVFQGIGSLFGSLVNVDLDVCPVHVDHIKMRQHSGHVFNISKLVLAFESDRRELPSESEALPAEFPPDESAAGIVRVPCRVETKLIFDDPRIDRVEKLDIGEMSLFVLHDEARDIPFGGVYPKCKLRMVRGGSEVEIVGSEYWSRSDPPIRYEGLEDLNGRTSHVPKMRMVAQAHDYRREHSVTLYQVPLPAEICLAGQTCFFSDEIFRNLYLIALRSHRKGGTRLRKISLLAVPGKDGKGIETA